MALWQFALDAIPRSAAVVHNQAAIHLDQDQIDSIRFDMSPTEQTRLLGALGAILTKKISWSPNLQIWGDEKEHDIQVWSNEGGIEFVQIRIDVSRPSLSLIGQICALARSFGWVFATKEGAVLQPSHESLVRGIMQSKASQFVKDPRGYLEKAILADSDGSQPS